VKAEARDAVAPIRAVGAWLPGRPGDLLADFHDGDPLAQRPEIGAQRVRLAIEASLDLADPSREIADHLGQHVTAWTDRARLERGDAIADGTEIQRQGPLRPRGPPPDRPAAAPEPPTSTPTDARARP